MAEAGTSYSFIDIAAWDGVRENFLSGKPIAVFTQDLGTLMWANGSAATLFGFSSIGEFEAEGPDGMRIALRQIQSAASRAVEGEEIRTLLRITSGMSSKLLPAHVRRIRGRDGTPCIMVVIDTGETDNAEHDTALAAISGLAAEGAGAAIVDAEGALVAADALFSGLSFPADAIHKLVRDVRGEEDRLVKRLVSPKPATPVAVAIVRLTDSPARHLIMAIRAAETEEEHAPAPAVVEEPVEEDSGVTAWEELVEEAPAAVVEEIVADVVEPAPEAVEPAPETEPVKPARPFVPDFENLRGPVRFVWKTNRDGRFTDISPEFASAVGPNAADIAGRTFEEVARVFDLDPSGEISASLIRHDTWSGKSVMWPVQETAFRVPVDLAALPSYNREREFEGYRGFGIVRMGERSTDPEALGLSLTTSGFDVKPVQPPAPEMPEAAAPEPASPEVQETEAAPSDPFEGETPALSSIAPQPMRRESDKIIDLNSKRRSQPPGEALNPSEQAAFRQIGDVLGWARVKKEEGESAGTGKPELPQETARTGRACRRDRGTGGRRRLYRGFRRRRATGRGPRGWRERRNRTPGRSLSGRSSRGRRESGACRRYSSRRGAGRASRGAAAARRATRLPSLGFRHRTCGT